MKNNKDFLHLLKGRLEQKQEAQEEKRTWSRSKRGIAGVVTMQAMMDAPDSDFDFSREHRRRLNEEVGYETAREISTQRVMNYINQTIRESVTPYIGQQNDDMNRDRMVAATERVVLRAIEQGAISQGHVNVVDNHTISVTYHEPMSVERIVVDINVNS